MLKLTVAAIGAVLLAACGGSETRRAPPQAAVHAATSVTKARPHGVVEDCSTNSEANFPAAFTDPRNVVAGPLALVGADFTPPSTIREFGGDKFPVLVRAGHRVTIALPGDIRTVAGLGYGPLPEGVELSPADGHRVVTFISCRRGEPSSSSAGGQPVTFWAGFVLTRSPRCVPLAVWVDDDPSPRRIALRMGVRRCS